MLTSFDLDASLLPLLRCPRHPEAGPLPKGGADGQPVGLSCPHCRREYPVVDGIPVLLAEAVESSFNRDGEMRQWDEQAARYDAGRLQDLIYRAGVEATAEAVRPADGDLILDAGCGTGLTVKRYARPGVRVVALDLSLQSLKYLRQTAHGAALQLVQGDLTALPFARDAFDTVLCSNTITQLPDEELRAHCLRELTRVARPAGRVIVTAQCLSIPKQRAGWIKEGPAKGYSGPIQYLYRYEAAEFRDLLATCLEVEGVWGAGLPLPYRLKLSGLSRRLERWLRRFQASAPWGNILVGIGRKPAPPPDGLVRRTESAVRAGATNLPSGASKG
jgi:ubiquinone/menaquinone biosynthesis C-methylase UbiE